MHALRQRFPRPARARPSLQIQVLGSLFFRNKAAYVVGKLINGNLEVPFAVPILRNGRGELYLDALLSDADQLIVLFSFSRAYFFVDMEVPAAYVSFLRQLMPKKPRAEMYMAVGLAKQGKTMFYRDLFYHLKHSSDNFAIAPGIKGMVMLVFTLPSFPYVFKIIRDRFAPQKEMDRQTVKDKYQLVKMHDRVGRLADTLEYSLVALPLDRFEPDVLEELKSEAASNIEFEDDKIVIKHVYIERRMQPLNLFIAEAGADRDEERLRHALWEYGYAIKELAGAGIFPGDMLLKNFGVTRHNRVVFYDYDEIAYMIDCNFRRIPPPRSIEDEMSAEPYYSVGAERRVSRAVREIPGERPGRARDIPRAPRRPDGSCVLVGQAGPAARRPARRRLPLPGRDPFPALTAGAEQRIRRLARPEHRDPLLAGCRA